MRFHGILSRPPRGRSRFAVVFVVVVVLAAGYRLGFVRGPGVPSCGVMNSGCGRVRARKRERGGGGIDRTECAPKKEKKESKNRSRVAVVGMHRRNEMTTKTRKRRGKD